MVKRGDIREIVALAITAPLFMIVIPLIALLVFGEAESQANITKWFFFGVQGSLPVLTLILIRLLQSEGWFSSIPKWSAFSRMTVHSPKNTWFVSEVEDVKPIGSWIARQIKDPFKFLFWSIWISAFFGLGVGLTNTFVSGFPSLTEASFVGDLLLAVEPAVYSETMLVFVFAFWVSVASLATFFRNRFEVADNISIAISKFMSIFIVGIGLWVGYHLFRYSNQEASLIGVGILGLLSTVSISITDSIILAYCLHWFGNLFHRLSQLGTFTSELMIVVTIGSLIGFSFIYIFLFDPWGFIRDGNLIMPEVQ